MKTYQIHFIRHGIIEGNIKGQYIGSTDSPLSAFGAEKIKALVSSSDYPNANAFFTSPMRRCRETLSLIYPSANQIVIDGLRECCFGEFEGYTAKELEGNKDFAEWISGGGVDAPPGGESAAQFSKRIFEAFELIVNGLIKTGTTSSVIVTHAGVIMSILANYGLPKAPMTDWIMENGCGYSCRIHPQLWTSGKVMEVYDVIPNARAADTDEEQQRLLDAGRQAAHKASSSDLSSFGEGEQEEE
ncbi:MAG: histidine phosphatase family protein [Oscillospiraceae bacterium]|jgi:alpha-ribazole phosphatase|nr:histidine phosphatase family protein [Oscillospiraceae bacterium]